MPNDIIVIKIGQTFLHQKIDLSTSPLAPARPFGDDKDVIFLARSRTRLISHQQHIGSCVAPQDRGDRR
jgi:hypothetical protein